MGIEENIDAYLMDDMGAEEKLKFEKDMKADKSLANEVVLRQQFLNGINSMGRADLKNDLKEIQEDYIKDKSKGKTIRLWGLIGFMLLSIICYFLVNHYLNSKKAKPNLYAAYYSPYKMTSAMRSGDSIELDFVKTKYEQQSFAELIKYSDDQQSDFSKLPSESILVLGIAHLELNNYDQSVELFNQIFLREDFNFEDTATWYTALVYLKKGDHKTCLEWLKKLSSDESRDYHSKAKTLEQKLN